MGYVFIIFGAVVWIAAWLLPGGPEGPVYKFGLESNTAAFLINTATLIVLVFFIAMPLRALVGQGLAARKEAGIYGRLKWFGLTYIRAAVMIGLWGTVGIYLTGESSGIMNGMIKTIVVALFVTPLFMWVDARGEHHETNSQEPGLFERLGTRAGRYIGRRSRQ